MVYFKQLQTDAILYLHTFQSMFLKQIQGTALPFFPISNWQETSAPIKNSSVKIIVDSYPVLAVLHHT